MSQSVHDLDAFLAEQAGDAPVAKMGGREWPLPDLAWEDMLPIKRYLTVASEFADRDPDEDLTDDDQAKIDQVRDFDVDEALHLMAGDDLYEWINGKTDGRPNVPNRARMLVFAKLTTIHEGAQPERPLEGKQDQDKPAPGRRPSRKT